MTERETLLCAAGRGAELSETIKGPGGEYLVEVQDDGRWTVDHIIDHNPDLYGSANMGNYPTREDAMYYARRYASGHSRPEFRAALPEHPLPDRKAAIAHTRAKQ